MAGSICAFCASTSGSIAVIAAVCAPLVFTTFAVATDYAMMGHIRVELQAAADAAALAGAKEMTLSGATEKQVTAVTDAYARHELRTRTSSDSKSGTIDVGVSVLTGKRMVEVSIEERWTPFFLHFVKTGVTPIKVNAQARTMGLRLACVLGLSRLAPPGVQLWSEASLTAKGCDIYSNTSLPTGLIVKNNATMKADLICVSGGYVALRPRAVEPVPTTDCPVFEDPLASRKAPDNAGCDYMATVVATGTKTLNPGVYCGGLTILGKAKVTLNPGVYVIHNGLLKVAGKASMVGQNVGFYLSGLVSLLQFDGGTTIDLTAPKDGPLSGLLFFEDRTAPPLRVHRIGSNNARNLVGTIYLPVGTLLIDSNGPVADTSAYTAIVVYSLQLRKGPRLVLRSDYEKTDVPVPDGLITGRIVLSQ